MATLQVLALAFTALSAAAASDGVQTFDQCAGNDFEGVRCCESDQDHCVKNNVFFSQCRPKEFPIPNGWDGQILRCDRECGPENTQLGEFITGNGCKLDGSLGTYTLEKCNTECASMGFIACDRPASAAPNAEASCWGYSESTPGGCDTRSGSTWVSWFVCLEDMVSDGGYYGYGDGGNGYGESFESEALADMVTGEAADEMRAEVEAEAARKL